jgi:pimeloyl-ACP methyl ester carboxylesterase
MSTPPRRHHREILSADGTPVGWDTAGNGEPAVLLCNGLTTNTHFWRHLLPALEARSRVLTWDLKGHGDSKPARSRAGASIEGVADDALRVLDAAGVHDAVVCGFSMGCQVALEIHRRAPTRVRALALLLGPAGRVLDTCFGPAGPALKRLMALTPGPAMGAVMPFLSRAGRSPLGPVLGRRLGFIGREATAPDIRGIVDHWAYVHGPSVRHLALSAAHHDARGHLPDVRVPTLVVAGDRDVFAPTGKVGAPIAAALPDARYVRLPHGTHASMLEHPDEVRAALLDFLDTLTPLTP